MKAVLVLAVLLQNAFGDKFLCSNVTEDATVRQLFEFKLEHPKPIGLWTINEGEPVEIRDTLAINSDLSLSKVFLDIQSHVDGERTPQRIVHAKGVAAWGWFEVTNDVSKYTKAKVFNGIGKKTKVLIRFSAGSQERGGSDLARELKGFVTKFYTEDGNLDFLSLQLPIFAFRDPLLFMPFTRAFTEKNRAAGMTSDPTAPLDLLTQRPEALLLFLYQESDYGLPNGYRKMDAFPIHTYVLNNDEGERYYVRFSWRSQQGLDFLTDEQAAAIQATDLDYFNRDLYNAIHAGNYPSWILEMDILTEHDILTVGYNPFDVTTLWQNGTYHTVPIGRLTVNKNSDNNFRDAEQSAFSPFNLVPGIPGPVDTLFKGRIFGYKDIHNYRISRNHDNTLINHPHFDTKTYNEDGKPPIRENNKDAPVYYPNSFNGPVPYVDETRPWKQLRILESNAIDLQGPADFINKVLSEAARDRLAGNIARQFNGANPKILERVVRLFYLTDHDFGDRVVEALRTRLTCRV